jgi:hypothetical protein
MLGSEVGTKINFSKTQSETRGFHFCSHFRAQYICIRVIIAATEASLPGRDSEATNFGSGTKY